MPLLQSMNCKLYTDQKSNTDEDDRYNVSWRPPGRCAYDIGVVYDGWVADAARTFPVGPISPIGRKLLTVTEESLNVGLAANIVRSGTSGGTMRIAPPLIVTDAELDEGLALLDRAIETVVGG